MAFSVIGDKFAGHTLSQMRSLALRKLRVTNTERYSPTAGIADYTWIDGALNVAQINFAKKTKCVKSYAVIEFKANYRSYRAPQDFLDLAAAYYYDTSIEDGYRELLIKSTGWLNDEISDWRTNTDSPDYIYVDRIHGNQWILGFCPIPDTDGDTVIFDTEFGVLVDWICPAYSLNQEYGTFIRIDDNDKYFLSTDVGVVGKIEELNKNALIEYYRLPLNLEYEDQYPDIPNEYHEAIVDDAVRNLLQDNPEDSVEFKRSIIFENNFSKEVDGYIEARKKPLTGNEMQARAAVWNWTRNMPWYKELP